MNVEGTEVLLEPMTLRRSGNRYNPRLPRQQPGERDLGRGRVLEHSERLQPLDEYEVRLPVLLREPRHHIAKIGRLERRLVVDRAGQEALAERAEGHEADAEFLERRQDLALGLAPPERVFAL